MFAMSLSFLIVMLSSERYLLISVQSADNTPPSYPQIIVSHKSSLAQITEVVNRTGENFTIPLGFKELHFECTSNYPNRWILVPSPQRNKNGSNLKEWSISKRRSVSNISNESSYRFSSTLSMIFFTNMPNRGLNQYVACRHAYSYEELINTNLTLTSSELNLFGNFTHGIKLSRAGLAGGTRYGRNKNCDIRLHLDTQQKRVACGSSNQSTKNATNIKPPTIIECQNPDECETDVEAENKTCMKSIQTSCDLPTCEPVAATSGIIVCESVADSKDRASSLAQIIYLTLDEPPQMFLDRATCEIATEKVLRINLAQEDWSKRESIFVNDSLTFHCMASMPCFTEGIQWAVASHNRELTYLGLGEERNNVTRHTHHSTMKIKFDSAGPATVFCFGPVWNSYDWKNLSFEVTVKNVISPVIYYQPSQNVTLKKGSNNSLKCAASGQPAPTLTWKKDETKIEKGIRSDRNESAIWSELQLNFTQLQQKEETKSKFVCEIVNTGGTRTIVYFVIVPGTDISKPVKIGLCVGIPLLVLILVGIIVYYILKTRHQKRNIQRLTEDEIMEFNNGDPHSQNNALFYPYNTDYEISRTMFHIESKILGKGQFGLVIKGKIGRAPVAIKTVKKSADIAYLKALLSELKIMCFVGKHDNIVNLIGASTEDIHKREVYIICEYCSNGNLLQYVQASRQIFVDHLSHEKSTLVRISTVDYQNASVKKLSSKDLIKWSYEIACGMEFLSRKNVVHGDLAARNILISEDLTAKVGDFGLSKQLFDYSIYVQKLECPLPLKWMAIESLRDLEFSIQSDVWSYGVTLWEMFSLGQVPYPGIQWDTSSYQLLLDGYRMKKPQFASDSIFNIILHCWEESPSARPCFSDLKNAFDKQMLFNKVRRSKKYYKD